MWHPQVTLFFLGGGRSKWNHHQLGCSEHQRHREGHQAGLQGKVSDFKAFERGLRHPPLWGGPADWGCSGEWENSRVPSGIRRTGTLWSEKGCNSVAAWSSQNPTLLPHITYGHLQKTTLGSTVAPRPRRCNLRAAVAACQTTEGASPLVQTGSERDPMKPRGRIRLLEQWQLD